MLLIAKISATQSVELLARGRSAVHGLQNDRATKLSTTLAGSTLRREPRATTQSGYEKELASMRNHTECRPETTLTW